MGKERLRGKLRAVAAAGLSCAFLAVSGPALAQRVSVDDRAGDTASPGLDITSVRFANNDHGFVTRLTFTRDRPGNIIVAIKTRGHRFVGIVSRHHRTGPDKTFVIQGSRCSGLTSDWHRSTATLTLRLPSTCLEGGNYGAIRSWALIENFHDGADVDYAPEKRDGSIALTDWIPRG